MAAIPINQQYLQVGPRQGVYCSNHSIRWRPTQFRDPAESYRFRERIDPCASNGFPSRSVRRPFSTTSSRSSNSRLSLPTAVLRGTPSNSSTSFGTSTKPWPQGQADSKKNLDTGSSGRSEGSKFSVTTQAIVIQPRPPQRSHTSTVISKSGDRVTTEKVFPYPDPYKIRGDPAFSVRIVELTRLECDTIKYEEWKRRTSVNKGSTIHLPTNSGNVRLFRSLSARPATPKGVSESVHKPTTSVAGKERFSTAPLLSRKSSLPATLNSAGINTYNSGGHHSRSLSVESCSSECSNLSPPTPTAASSRLSLSSGLQWPRREAHYETVSSEEDLHCSASQSTAASMPSSSHFQTSSQCPNTRRDMNENISPVEENAMTEGEPSPESMLQLKACVQNKDQQYVKDSLADSGLRNPVLSSQVSTTSIAEGSVLTDLLNRDISCEIGSCEDKDDLQVISILEPSVDSLHLSQEEEGVMSSIPERLDDNYSSGNEDQKINKANSIASATNDDANMFCRKKVKRKGGKKRNSKIRSHSTPRLEYTASVHSSHSTCSLKLTKSTKTHVHRKVKN